VTAIVITRVLLNITPLSLLQNRRLETASKRIFGVIPLNHRWSRVRRLTLLEYGGAGAVSSSLPRKKPLAEAVGLLKHTEVQCRRIPHIMMQRKKARMRGLRRGAVPSWQRYADLCQCRRLLASLF